MNDSTVYWDKIKPTTKKLFVCEKGKHIIHLLMFLQLNPKTTIILSQPLFNPNAGTRNQFHIRYMFEIIVLYVRKVKTPQ